MIIWSKCKYQISKCVMLYTPPEVSHALIKIFLIKCAFLEDLPLKIYYLHPPTLTGKCLRNAIFQKDMKDKVKNIRDHPEKNGILFLPRNIRHQIFISLYIPVGQPAFSSIVQSKQLTLLSEFADCISMVRITNPLSPPTHIISSLR